MSHAAEVVRGVVSTCVSDMVELEQDIATLDATLQEANNLLVKIETKANHHPMLAFAEVLGTALEKAQDE